MTDGADLTTHPPVSASLQRRFSDIGRIALLPQRRVSAAMAALGMLGRDHATNPGLMRLRTAVAALAGAACTALTAAALMAGPASAATAARQVIHRPSGAFTEMNISMKVNGTGTVSGTVAFDRQPTVELDFNVFNDGSIGISGTFTVFSVQNGNVATVCDNVPMHGFSEGDLLDTAARPWAGTADRARQTTPETDRNG